MTASHILFFNRYIENHAGEAAMMASTSQMSPRVMMALTGPAIGLGSGVVLGLFAVIASKLVAKPESHAVSTH